MGRHELSMSGPPTMTTSTWGATSMRRRRSSASRIGHSGPLPLEPISVLGFGISRKRLEQAIRDLQLPVVVVREPDEADVVITLRNPYKQKSPVIREAETRGLPIYVLKSNTIVQMQAILTSLFALDTDPSDAAMREVEEAIGLVRTESKPGRAVAPERLRARLQHRAAEAANLVSRSRGREPFRRVRVYPEQVAGLALSRSTPPPAGPGRDGDPAQAASSSSRGPTGPASPSRRARLAERLRGRGLAVTLTREPGGTRLGEQVRQVVLDPSDVARGPIADALLFNAARSQLVIEVIAPALARGDIVISDRYATSTLAYQGYGSGVDRDVLAQHASLGDRRPRARPRRRSSTSRSRSAWLDAARASIEEHDALRGRRRATTLAFHERVREGYLEMAAADPDRWVVVDGRGSPEDGRGEGQPCRGAPSLPRSGATALGGQAGTLVDAERPVPGPLDLATMQRLLRGRPRGPSPWRRRRGGGRRPPRR